MQPFVVYKKVPTYLCRKINSLKYIVPFKKVKVILKRS